MLTDRTPDATRDPTRDKNIVSKAFRLFKGEDTHNANVNMKFVRAFSWFPNTAVPEILQSALNGYIAWTKTFLADERDTIFITHIISSFLTVVPSTLYLLYRFNWIHAILHTLMLVVTIPPYILMLHCTCHKRVSKKGFGLADKIIHYVLPPFYGETLNTFYYHHVKHHHVEDNGSQDLSSTIWYDRDNALHFGMYFFRFYAFVGLELTHYFYKKGQNKWAMSAFLGEYGTLMFYASFFWICEDYKSVIFAWFVPLNLARFGMMSGNWTQHAFLDQDDPKNDYKSALTCLETSYNATAFNDGYHTSHHLNPIRHWQDHPDAFLKNVDTYNKQRVIVFRGIDYMGLWILLMIKDYDSMATAFVDFSGTMKHDDKKAFLKARTKRLSPEQISAAYKSQ